MRCLTALRDDKKGPAIELFTNDPAEEAAFIGAHDRPGITMTRCVAELLDTERKRRINTVASIDHLHVDIDVRGLFAITKEEIVERIKKMPLPLELIDSGGGIHVKARLKEPIFVGTREYDHACDLRTELMHILCGDPAVNHSAALMRIPGTTNFKYGEPILCQEVEPGSPVDLIDIETMIDMYQQPIFTRKVGKTNGKTNGNAHGPDLAARRAGRNGNGPLDIEAVLENMEFEGGEAGFNNTQWRVVGATLNRGIGTDVIVPMVMEASKKAAAGDPRCVEWNWEAERHNIEVMCLRSLEDKEDLYYLLPQRFVDVWEKNVRDGKKCKLVNAGGHIGWHVRGYESKEWIEEKTEESTGEKTEEQQQKEMPGVRFRLIRYQDMRPGIEPTYLVDELIPSQGLVLIWGKQKTFKSFWLLDLMLHIAQGWPYRDRAVRQGPVVYCAFEGGHGYKGRIEAQRRHYEISDDTEVRLYVMPGQANLIEEKGKMIADFRVQLNGVKPVIVVLDTLNRSLRGSENNAEDMGNYVAAAEAIRAEFGCVVVIVHHCGYDESHSRGSTALPAAVDAELEVLREPNNPQLVVTVKNMRDGPEGTVVRSRAERYPLDPGMDGRPKSSIIIVPDETAVVDHNRKGGRPDVAMAPLMAAMWAAVDTHGSQFSPDGKPPVKAVRDRHVRNEFYRRYVDGEETKDASRKAQTEAFKRGIKRAIAAGMLCGQKDDNGQQWLWLPGHAEEYR